LYLCFGAQLVWLEVPTNPLMKVVDVEAVVKAVKAKNESIIVVVDNTFLTPFFQVKIFLGIFFLKLNTPTPNTFERAV